MSPNLAIWSIAAAATAGVILRPFKLPEYVWALAGALLLVGSGLIPWQAALGAVAKGDDVYLFLIGMMLLSELARKEGLFDWLAVQAVRHAKGSGSRLFVLVYLVGTIVTIFMSNDATAVVLTPAVYAAARAAEAEPLPYLFVCAFIANAASFVLPISNPANLVVFRTAMPSLLQWLQQFALPSAMAIAATFVLLFFMQRRSLQQPLATDIPSQRLSAKGVLIAMSICGTALVLLAASLVGLDLGSPTFLCGIATTIAITIRNRQWPAGVVKDVSWGVLPLVAGLFVLVEGLQSTGVIHHLAQLLLDGAAQTPMAAKWLSGILTAIACNLVNNLPAGLIVGSAVDLGHVPVALRSALLIGVDLGPNLSVTGSLATLLWLVSIRREGGNVSALEFLALGTIVMPPALIAALAMI